MKKEYVRVKKRIVSFTCLNLLSNIYIQILQHLSGNQIHWNQYTSPSSAKWIQLSSDTSMTITDSKDLILKGWIVQLRTIIAFLSFHSFYSTPLFQQWKE